MIASTTLALALGGTEMLILAAIVGLLFFGKRLPEAARGVGKTLKSFKKEISAIDPRVALEETDKPMRRGTSPARPADDAS